MANCSNIQKSYSFNQRVTQKQLDEGVILPLHASGAVVHITPLQNQKIPSLELKITSSQFMNLKEASSLYSQDESLNESLHIWPHQTMLGAGPFILKSNKATPQNEANAYLINVFEKYSLIYLKI
ncbi:MAG: DUF4785 domain-containing protein [Legionella sp.]